MRSAAAPGELREIVLVDRAAARRRDARDEVPQAKRLAARNARADLAARLARGFRESIYPQGVDVRIRTKHSGELVLSVNHTNRDAARDQGPPPTCRDTGLAVEPEHGGPACASREKRLSGRTATHCSFHEG